MKERSKVRGETALAAFLAVLACIVAHGAAYADDTDPPGRVARLSDAEGSVSLQPAGVQDWASAALNRPLTIGDRLWSDRNSRAELDIGAAVIRLGNSTGFAFLNLDDRTAQMQLATGTLIVRVRDMQAGDNYEVDTPNVALSLQQPGEYRVEVNDRGDATLIKVSEGAAVAAGGGQTIAIGAQELLTVTGTDTLAYSSAPLGGPDDLDNWSSARERQVEDSASAEYVASDIPGTQDLDDNGQWQETPEYGYVWLPTAAVAGWVPYRFGHWMWISPWGWTWVDDAPWGYAPFHYGRWVQWNNSWAWVPGPRRVRPMYGPAFVAWVGGPAVGTSVAFGSNVGWFPLGPREVYVPNTRVSSTYVRNVNTTNTTLVNTTYITNIYQNRLTPTHYANNRAAAVTTVPQDIFTSGQRVGGHAVALPASILAGALVTATAPAIAPIRQSVLGPAEGHGVVRPPAALLNKAVVARTSPPHAPASFERQRAAIQANGGSPLARAEIAQLQPVTADARVRLTAPTGPLVAASALTHRAGADRAGPPSAHPPAGTAATAGLAERERVLQSSPLPSAPHVGKPETPPAGGVMYTPHPPTQEHNFTADDPTHAYGRPSSIPVYHPPSATDAYTRAQESTRTQDSYQAAPRAAPPPRVTAPPSPPPVRPQAPPPGQQSSPRDSAPHADRESRERVVR